ncbi:hypothetical protein F5Y15DRAFT_415888 [Xylariaceae sp. FL0016]|nr:hypothetical protein F5Y15DRAFT_415888 [Xylariaceae sp. FL0016]
MAHTTSESSLYDQAQEYFILAEAAKQSKVYKYVRDPSYDPPLPSWVREVRQMGAQSFIDAVEKKTLARSQEETCRTLIARLLVTKLGRHVAEDLKSSECSSVAALYIDRLHTPAYRTMALVEKRPDAVAKRAWIVGHTFIEAGPLNCVRVPTICHDDAIGEQDWSRTEPCALGLVEFIEFVAMPRAEDLASEHAMRPIPIDKALRLLLDAEPMTLDEFLGFGEAHGIDPFAKWRLGASNET